MDFRGIGRVGRWGWRTEAGEEVAFTLSYKTKERMGHSRINQLVPSEPLLSFLSRLCTSSPGASKTFVSKAAGRNKLDIQKKHTTHIINVYIIHIHRHTYAHTHICDKFHKILSTFTCGMC